MLSGEIRQHRLSALRRSMASEGLDVVAIVPGANFQYLTGGRFMSMEPDDHSRALRG